MFAWLTGKTAKSPELREAESVFTEEELKLIHSQFLEEVARLNGPGASRPARATLNGALDAACVGSLLGAPVWTSLEPLIASHLQLRLADPADGRVHLPGIVIAKARAERLGEQSSLEFSFRLLSPDGRGADYKALEAAVVSCLRLTRAVPLGQCDPRVNSVAGQPPPPPSPAAAIGTPGSSSTSTDPGSSNAYDKGIRGNSSTYDDMQRHVVAICLGALSHMQEEATAAGAALQDLRLLYEQYCKWTKACPALHTTLCGLLRRIGSPAGATAGAGAAAGGSGGGGGGHAASGPHPSAPSAPGLQTQLPRLLQLGKLSRGAALLQPVWTWALSSRLPAAQRAEWRLLFSSQRDGKSFNTFFGRVVAVPGPTLLLIRDKTGALFGGYASQPWSKSGTYYGDVSCFIFSLLPVFKVFPATGINENFQWCGVGFSQLPGGLGFGGAAAARGHFALYVEASLDSGMSRPIATYGNTPLASEQVFQIETLECWLLQPPEEELGEQSAGVGARKAGGSGSAGGGRSVLNKAAEDRAILELAGLKMHSGGLRDEPLEEG